MEAFDALLYVCEDALISGTEATLFCLLFEVKEHFVINIPNARTIRVGDIVSSISNE